MPWSRDDLTRLVELEAQQQGVDPRLAVALAEQESGFDPTIRSPKGATGIMQLMPGTAKQLKVNLDDPADNIRGGVTYLKQQLDAFGGDQAQALAAYNAGPAVVKAYGKVPPYKETQGFVSRILGKLGPSSAEASTAAPARSRLEELEAELARRDAQTPVEAPRSPQEPATSNTTTSAPPTQPGASQGPPTPDTSPTPGMRFQALPSITQLEPADRIQKTAAFERLKPELQEEFLRSEEPTAAGLAMGAGPVAQSQPVTDPAALLAMGRRAPGWREGDPLPPEARRPPTPTEAPVEEGITKPSTMLPLVTGLKAPALGARTGMRLVPEAWRWLGRIGGETVVQAGAELAGKTIETGQVPSFKDIATTTAWNLAPQAGEELLRAVPRTILRSGQGARTIISDVAAQESKGLGRRVFHPEDEQVLSQMFNDVKASGVKLDIDPVTDLFTSLTPTQRQVLLRDVKAISSPLAAALQRTGTPGASRLTGWDIGDLQTMRSELLKRAHTVRAPERQDLINEMRMAVDDAIGNGMAVGSRAAGGNPEMLKAAQAGWRRLKQSDDLQALVTKHTSFSPNLKYQDLNLAALRKSLEGTNPLGRKVAASLGNAETTALQQELTTLAKRYPFVKVPSTVLNITGGAGLPAAGYQLLQGNIPGAAATATAAVMALALQSPRAMEVFRSAIVHGKGRLSSNDIASIVNAVRQVSNVEEPSGTPQ